MGLTANEIQTVASGINWDKMHEATVARAQAGCPKSMMQLAKNDTEARLAIEKWLGAPLIPVAAGVVLSTAPQAMSIAYIHVHAETDFRDGKKTGNYRVYGYIKSLKRRGELMPSFELALDQASAKALAKALNASLKSKD